MFSPFLFVLLFACRHVDNYVNNTFKLLCMVVEPIFDDEHQIVFVLSCTGENLLTFINYVCAPIHLECCSVFYSCFVHNVLLLILSSRMRSVCVPHWYNTIVQRFYMVVNTFFKIFSKNFFLSPVPVKCLCKCPCKRL